MRRPLLAVALSLLALTAFASPSRAPARQVTGEPVQLTARRSRISLDGPWRFQPAPSGGPVDESAWGGLAVPGTWAGASPGLDNNLTIGSGRVWRDFDGARVGRAWYERSVLIPVGWAGQSVVLSLDRVSTDALVFVDGKSAGIVRWPSGDIDITSAVHPGALAQIRLLVVAAPSEAEADSVLSGRPVQPVEGGPALRTRGLIGSVALESRPPRVTISDLAIEPSTRKRQLGLAIEVTGPMAAGNVDITARLLDEGGRDEKQFTGQAASVAADRQVVRIAFPWPDPRLWDLDSPNIYTLVLSVRGGGLDDEVRATFGFREFWIDGRRFYLNGVPIRLRPDSVRDIEPERQAGFNCTVVPPEDPDERGTPDPDPAWLDAADHAGWLTTGRLPGLGPYLFDATGRSAWTDARRRAWTERADSRIRRLRNHPSLLIWMHSPGLFGTPQEQNPRVIGRIDRARRGSADPAYQAGLEACAMVKTLDSTRPVTTYNGADAGDVYTVNLFLDLMPLQERQEWLTDWVRNGDMPVLATAFGTPLVTAFLRGRTDYAHAVATEPLVTEYAAIYLGREGYLDESAEYRASVAARFEGQQVYRFDPDQDLPPIVDSTAFQKVEALFNRETWRGWRTTGITGGMVPTGRYGWHGTDLTESGRALAENNGPTLAWIAGPGDAATARTHAYHVDENVEKQVALINDTRRAQNYHYVWTALLNGKRLTSDSGNGQIGPAQTLFRPLHFATPFFRTGRADGEIELSVTIGGHKHEDRFAFQVFARRPRRDHPPSMPIFDPGGKTGDTLPVVDYVPRAWKGERSVPMVVIGQNAFSSGRRLPGDLESYVRGGGRALVFAQRPEWIEKALGMRTAAAMARRVYPVAESHPLMRGIDPLDLRDWRGMSSVVQVKPVYTGDAPIHGWRWGSRGAVASISIEKPHMGSWRPILEDEFDLAYSPLMEMDYGRGRVIWCSLDIEDHAATDAAAERVFGRIFDYALHAPLSPKADRVVYVGDRPGARRLSDLGLIFRDTGAEKADSALLSGPAAPQLLIAGDTSSVEAADLAPFLERGGRVLFLRRDQPGAGVAPRVASMSRHGSHDVPSWFECRGLGVSDLHWRADLDVPVIQALPDLSVGTVHGIASIGADGLLGRIELGKGVAIFCQVAPDSLDADSRTYLRLTRWRQTRTLCQLLSNLGASFHQDERFFHAGVGTTAPGFYYPDYRADFELGDDPYRYSAW